MTSLRHYDWRTVYESQPSEDRAYLVEEFYQPALERATQYDRIAGYFNSGSLAAATKGIETFINNEAEMRLIVGAQLQERDRPVLETLEDEFEERFTDLDEDQLEGRLEILAWLLENDRLEIKVAEPKRGNWGVFHPKVGIFHDDDGNRLSFEGSINETKSGWTMNYERFKVHRSWRHEEATYLAADEESFDQLWADEHPYVDVYDLSTAIKENIIDWQSPDYPDGVEKAKKKAKGEEIETGPNAEASVADYAHFLANGGKMPGGLHIAEEAATIDPWPHQRVVSDTAVSTYPQSFLFCDEVGLGKTIEIGLTLSRLAHTGEIQNSLLLVPAGLTQQWQSELWEKFNLVSYRYDRQPTGEYEFIDPFGQGHTAPGKDDIDIDSARADEAWLDSEVWRFVHQQQQQEGPALVVMSWHTARLSNYWSEIAPGEGPAARTRDRVPASIRGRSPERREGVWDTVVVDEAHNARRTTNLYELLEELRPHTQNYYMLTATPMQLHHAELYDLLTLLELPDAWDDRDDFKQFFRTRRALGTQLQRGQDTDPTSDIETQQTLDGEYQAGLDTALSRSEEIYLGVSQQLGLEDEAQARGRLFDACRLARGYGEAYDGYADLVQSRVDEADLDPFAGEERQLKELLFTDEMLQSEPWVVGRNDRLTALDELSEEGWNVVAEILDKATPVNALLHRNTRDTLRKYHEAGILDETVADRKPERKNIPLTDTAKEVYERIDEYTEKFYKKAQEMETQSLGFVMTTYRQRLTSSVAAITNSLTRRLETLEKQQQAIERKTDLETDLGGRTALEGVSEAEQMELAELENSGEEILGMDIAEIVPGDTEQGLQLIEDEIAELRSFIDDVRKIALDPKIQQLREDLMELDRQGHNRILIFTQYTDTLDYVRNHLEQSYGGNVATYSGRGGEMYDKDADEWYGVSKEEVKRAFAADEAGIDILVGTEAASEGLNLQECGAVINYDLPWNPMKVEQRIGRVDRIGQEHSEITIYHYVYENTIENDIYDALDERIGMFEDVVGDLQPILAGVNQSIKSATLEGETEGEDIASSLSSEMDAVETSGETVEVQDSLTDVEDSEKEVVLENARLEAWSSFRHPDIEAIGEAEYRTVPFTADAVREVMIKIFADEIGEIELASVEDYPHEDLDEEVISSTYLLTIPDQLSPHYEVESGTLASKLAEGEEKIAVTFDGNFADEYPSLRYLQPGEPLFNSILKLAEQSGSLSLEWASMGERDKNNQIHCDSNGQYPVVVTVEGEDLETLTINSTGKFEEVNIRHPSIWCTEYAQN